MTLLVLGVILWMAAHFFKRVAPDARAALGEKGKPVMMAVMLVSLVLMIVGYRGAEYVHVYDTPGWAVHLNNLLMVIAVVLMGAGNGSSHLRDKMRHPMLAGVKTWAIAHLIVNGDLASVVLFGGMLLWAVLEVVVINRAEGPRGPYHEVPIKKEITALVATVIVFTVVGAVHALLGYNPFG